MNITVKDIFSTFLQEKRDEVKESTYERYRFLIYRHILPDLGSLSVHDITCELLNTYLKHLHMNGRIDHKGGLSAKTVMDIRSLLMCVLKEYCEGHKLYIPKSYKKEIQVFTLKEQRALEVYLHEHMDTFALSVLLTLYTGIRIGELCALQWKDIDTENHCIHIHRTLMRIHEQNSTRIIITEPKTFSSSRVIPCPSFLASLLFQYSKDRQAYVLTGTSVYMEPRACHRHYTKLLKDAGIVHHTFHALRHTFATRCIEKGVDVKSLSEILGHSDITVTLQRYVHPTMEQKKKEVEKLSYAAFWNEMS